MPKPQIDKLRPVGPPLATPAQRDYLEILFNDLGYTLKQRHAQIKADFGVYGVDELTAAQASALIDELKRAKIDKYGMAGWEED